MNFWEYLWVLLCMLACRACRYVGGYTQNTYMDTSGHLRPEVDRYPSAEARLVRHLLSRYGSGEPRMVRPVVNSSEPIVVRFTLSLVQVLDINEKEQLLSAIYWIHMRWEDQYLTWNPLDFDGQVAIGLQNKKIWLPDIRLYNRVDRAVVSLDEESTDTALVYYNGTVVYIPSAIFSSSCPLDMTHFPFDTQKCALYMASWIYDSSKLDIEYLWGRNYITLESYINNSEWTIVNSEATKSYEMYDCCLKPYAAITFSLTLKRKATMHMKLIVLPTSLLTIMTIVIFCIPAHRPDRIGMSMSLFSSFFLLLIMGLNISPPTSKSKLGQFWCGCIIMVTMATITSVIIISLLTSKVPVPKWLDKILLERIGPILLPCTTQRPSKMESRHPPHHHRNHMETPPDPTQKWQVLGLVIDRILFIIYFVVIVYVFTCVFPSGGEGFF